MKFTNKAATALYTHPLFQVSCSWMYPWLSVNLQEIVLFGFFRKLKGKGIWFNIMETSVVSNGEVETAKEKNMDHLACLEFNFDTL